VELEERKRKSKGEILRQPNKKKKTHKACPHETTGKHRGGGLTNRKHRKKATRTQENWKGRDPKKGRRTAWNKKRSGVVGYCGKKREGQGPPGVRALVETRARPWAGEPSGEGANQKKPKPSIGGKGGIPGKAAESGGGANWSV